MELEMQTNILHLPEEILFKIMKLAGCCSIANHSIRYVCKQFYKVYCTFTSCGFKITSNLICDDAIIRSMMHSLRRPFRFDIENPEDCAEGSKLREIIKHFAIHVRTLRFKRPDGDQPNIYRLADLAFIMRLMVNVEEITFSELKILECAESELVNNPTIQMPMLKRIIVVDCVDAESIDRLLTCVSARSLEEFYVQGHAENVLDFNHFFKNNRTINNIAMAVSGKVPNLKALEHLQLSKLQIYFDGNWNKSSICDALAHQPKLRYLNLLPDQEEVPYDYWFDEDEDAKGTVHDDLFTVICSLTDLESLKIAIGEVTPVVIGKIASLTNLKELALHAAGGEADYEIDYDYDVSKMRSDVNFQKCFRKLIATPLPKLESFTWTLRSCEWDNEYFMSDDEEFMEAARRTEYSSLDRVNIIATMAPSFPLLKCLKIEMKTDDSSDRINVRDALKRLRHLETLQLKVSSTFNGGPISTHEHIKHVKINEIEEKFLIEMLGLMPNLETLQVRSTVFSLNKLFLQDLEAAIPDRLKKLELNFNSRRHEDFATENIVILQNIIKRMQTGKIKLTGNCDFDSLAEKIDRSVGVSLPRSPKWYIPGDDYGYESYMQLWK